MIPAGNESSASGRVRKDQLRAFAQVFGECHATMYERMDRSLEVMKKFGFGCMRLPMKDGSIDYEEMNRMVDAFIEAGFCYFDTAHGYMGRKSETAVRDCLVRRYPRPAYILTDKLTTNFFHKEEDIRPFFENQLEWCGVEYFDYYLMHALSADPYEKFVRCNAFGVAQELKKEGKIKHIGISFHDKAEVLDKILNEQPSVEVVQLQLNYIDYDDPGIESRKCYEVCVKHNKPVIVMEPIKGGKLADLPQEAGQIFDQLGSQSYASYAVRFAASHENVCMVLSGMSNMEQMEDNLNYMKDFQPLSKEEYAAIEQVVEILRKQDEISCTACRYCTDGCPKKIAIPDLFSCYNAKKQYRDWNSDFYYGVHTIYAGKASDCVGCGQCEKACPQHLPIRELLKDVAEAFEAKK